MSDTTGNAPAPDPTPIPAADPAPVAAPVAAPEPALAAPIPEPAAPAPAADAPAADPAKPTEAEPAKPETPAIEPAPADLPSLEDAGKKPDEAKPGDKPVEGEKPAEIVDGPVYEFKAPEGVEFVPERMAAYTEVLKAHNITPETGQALLDMHTQAIQQMAVDSLANQYQVFNDTLKGWDDQRRADPEIGGSGIQTATQIAAQARDMVFKTPEERSAFDKMCKDTGCGRHPEFWRAFYRFGKMFQEPEAPPDNRNPPPNPQGRPRSGIGSIFTHPTSQRTV